MAIKRRLTQTPERKRLQLLANMPWFGQARAALIAEGNLAPTHEDAAEKLAADISSVLDDAHYSESSRPGVEGRTVLTDAERKEIDALADKLHKLVITLSDELDDLRHRFGEDDY